MTIPSPISNPAVLNSAKHSKHNLPMSYCPDCGTALVERPLPGEGLVPWCPRCEAWRFPLYNVAVSMLVVRETDGRILLVKQYGRPSYILVAGYVNRGEALEHAVAREVLEETGMTVSRLCYNRSQFFAPSNTLMCNFTAWVSDADDYAPNEEIDEGQWFTPDEARAHIRPDSLAQHFLNAALDAGLANAPAD